MMKTLDEKKSVEVKYLLKRESPNLKKLKSERFVITMCKQGACNGPGNPVYLN